MTSKNDQRKLEAKENKGAVHINCCRQRDSWESQHNPQEQDDNSDTKHTRAREGGKQTLRIDVVELPNNLNPETVPRAVSRVEV